MSTIHIDNEDDDSSHTTLLATLTLNGRPIIAAACPSVAKKWARVLNQARDSGPREGMRLLTEELGMCDDAARHVLADLTGITPNLN